MRPLLRNLSRIILILICGVATSLIIYFSSTAGDIFLTYLGNHLGLDISYKNRCGLVSSFLLKSIFLKEPEFIIKGSDLSVICKGAYIRPDFKHLFDKGIINLECDLREPILLKSGKGVHIFFTEIPGMDMVGSLLSHTDVGAYERLFCDIDLFEKTVRINNFYLFNDDIKLFVSGALSTDMTIDIKLKLFLSPDIVTPMPEGLRDLLEEEASGWGSFAMEMAGSSEKPSLKIESKRFRFRFGEIVEE